MAARIGAIVAPFVKELGEATHVTVALAIFGLLSIINALVLLKYGEETTGKDIPDTMEEGDKVIELREEVSKESTHEPLKEKPQQELLKS